MKNIDYKDFEANERVLLVGVYETGSHSESRRSDTESEEEFYHSMDELYELARACLMYPAGQVVQRMERIHNALYLGPGKLDEVMERAEELEASLTGKKQSQSVNDIPYRGNHGQCCGSVRTVILTDHSHIHQRIDRGYKCAAKCRSKIFKIKPSDISGK